MKEQADLAALMDSLAPLLKDKRLASSPILRGVPPKVYLKPFLDDPDDLVPFTGGVKHYQALAAVVPNLMGVPLTSEHQKVINIMHAEKLLLSREYSKAPQDTLLSIIMPTKNRAGALEGAILSIMVQSYKNWELIVINDGGDDAPESVIAAFNDPRIIYIRLENSVGAAAARNIGLNSSRGEFIAYLDDDDQWDPDFLLICHGELVKYKRRFIYSAQIVWHGFEAESNLGKEYLLVRYVPFNRSLIENSNFISMICCMHEKSLCAEAGTFDAGLKNGVDWEFFL